MAIPASNEATGRCWRARRSRRGGDQGCDHRRAGVGGADPRFGGGNRGGSGGLGCTQFACLIAGTGGGRFEAGDLTVGVGGLGAGAGEGDVNWLGGYRDRRAACRQEQWSSNDQGGTAHDLPFAVIRVVRKDRCRAEQLFGEHRPDQQVRPGRRTE